MHSHPTSTGPPRFDIADIVRAHRHELEQQHPLGPAEARVLTAIALCRTSALGGHREICRSCGHESAAYNSCRNRHCPKCQGLAQERWIASRAERLLPVRHFHVVFTLPSELRTLCRHAPRAMYDALFERATATLLELAMSRWRALPGITAVLHTWTREMHLHPHLHMLVTAGGLHLWEDRWVHRKRFLFRLDMMAEVYRAKMLEALRTLHREGVFQLHPELDDPEAFGRLLTAAGQHKWIVYTKEPFRRADFVLRYLGRYTHRVALSNSRLLEVTPTQVTFRTRGTGTVSLTPVEFLRRFVQHVLPDGLHKIRHFGLYASANAQTRWVQARDLLGPAEGALASPAAAPTDHASLTWQERLLALTGRDVRSCPLCGGVMDKHPLARAPPAAA
ncbi:MAG: IS91 family transposase [Deltaproteobacteria bacterium]|nr:IS91 family transposase [Deltaproteobacteria bacterium]